MIKIKLCAVICMFFLAGCGAESSRNEGGSMNEDIKMSYRLEGAYSPYRYVQADIKGEGRLKIEYELYSEYVNESPSGRNVVEAELEKNKVRKMLDIYLESDFFNVEFHDLNKESINVTDVGTTTLSLSYGDKERTISYGYIEENPFQKILQSYWSLLEKHLPVR